MVEKKKIFYIGLILIFYCSGIFSKVVFKDDFSNPANSNLKWVVLSEDDTPLNFTNNKAELINNSTNYIAVALHSLETTLNSFSYTVTFVDNILGGGVFYNSKKVGGKYCGYSFLFGEKEIVVVKFDSSGIEEIVAQNKCDFIKNKGNNIISISGDKDQLLVFCNGYFQFSLKNTMGELQGIGVVSPMSSSVIFDDVIVEDRILDSLCFSNFNSDFYDTTFTGWGFEGEGVLLREGKELRITTASNWIGNINLKLQKFSAIAILKFEECSENTLVGFSLSGDNNPSYFLRFLINPIKRRWYFYDIKENISAEDSLVDYQKNSYGDTLYLERNDSNKFIFCLNNIQLGEISNTTQVFNQLSIYLNGNTTVLLKEFSILNSLKCEDETQIFVKKNSYFPESVSPLLFINNFETFFDLRGRKFNSTYSFKKPLIIIKKRKAYLLNFIR